LRSGGHDMGAGVRCWVKGRLSHATRPSLSVRVSAIVSPPQCPRNEDTGSERSEDFRAL
jgi:hypothetical protein